MFKNINILILLFISLSSYGYADNSSWMSNLSDDTNLNEIVMVGSHDAGMSETNYCNFFIKSAWTKTQSLDILGQLNAGARYFDIRPATYNNQLLTQHTSNIDYVGVVGCYGQQISKFNDSVNDYQILTQASNFLTENPSETILLKFSHTFDDTDIETLVKNISEFKDQIHIPAVASNLANAPIKDLRGKMLILFDSHDNQLQDYISQNNFISSYEDGSSSFDANLSVYDEYSNTTDLDKMYKDQSQKFIQYAGLGKDYLFLLSWTLSGDIGNLNIKYLAKKANKKLSKMIQNILNYSKTDPTKLPNIIYLDFINETIASEVINLNAPKFC